MADPDDISFKGLNIGGPSGTTTQEVREKYNQNLNKNKGAYKQQILFKIYSLIEGKNLNGKPLEIFGSITNFAQTWNSSFNEEVVYGRIDPIPTFSNTTRTISFSLDLISPKVSNEITAEEMAERNTFVVGRLAQMCYPGYDSQSGATEFNISTLKSAPLVKIRYGNLICGDDGQSFLTAYMKSMSVTFATDKLTVVRTNKQIDYKRMTLSMEFGIVHDFDVGHDASGVQLNPRYPFSFE